MTSERNDVLKSLQQMRTDLEIMNNTSDDMPVCHALGSLRGAVDTCITSMEAMIEEDEIRACSERFGGHDWDHKDHTVHTRCIHCRVERLTWIKYVTRQETSKNPSTLELLKVDMIANGATYTHDERRRMIREICEQQASEALREKKEAAP